jgi:hypothetical protein
MEKWIVLIVNGDPDLKPPHRALGPFPDAEVAADYIRRKNIDQDGTLDVAVIPIEPAFLTIITDVSDPDAGLPPGNWVPTAIGGSTE